MMTDGMRMSRNTNKRLRANLLLLKISLPKLVKNNANKNKKQTVNQHD